MVSSPKNGELRWMRGEHSIMGAQDRKNEGLEHYFIQQPDYISTATFMEERMRMKKEALKI